MDFLSKLLDRASDYFAHRKGLLPSIGIALIILNFLIVSIFPTDMFIVETNLFLHCGLVIALFGLMLAWAL